MSKWVGMSLGLAMLVAGCAPKRPQVFPVRGQLFWEGQPAAGAVVFFHPVSQTVDNQNPANEPRPAGRVEEDGLFEMCTYGIKDGVPPGQYRVSVVWTKGESENTTHLLPLRFMNPATSGLPIVEVGREPTELAPFQLTN